MNISAYVYIMINSIYINIKIFLLSQTSYISTICPNNGDNKKEKEKSDQNQYVTKMLI